MGGTESCPEEYQVFLSYNREDAQDVEQIARHLVERGVQPWLDQWNLIPGNPWQPMVEYALRECCACAIFVGPSGLGPWQHEEMRVALDHRIQQGDGSYRVIPVLLPGAERGARSQLPPFLLSSTWVEFPGTLDDENALHRLVCGIKGEMPHPALTEPSGVECPYKGLQTFDVSDAEFFFGREALVEWLLDALRPAKPPYQGSRFLAVIGPSGSGKSSVVRAGLVPAIQKGELPGSERWPVRIFRPGPRPLDSLALPLAELLEFEASPSRYLSFVEELQQEERTLHAGCALALRHAPDSDQLVLVVDQFEELFTVCTDPKDREMAIRNLCYAGTIAEGRAVVIITMRADFYGDCARYPELAAAISDSAVLVSPMSSEELRRAIELPARLCGRRFEPGLVDTVISDLAQSPASLPQLQHALLELWNQSRDRVLTHADYTATGGVVGALTKRAEAVYAGLNEPEKQICKNLLLRLVEPRQKMVDVRHRVPLSKLMPIDSAESERLRSVLHALSSEQARLIICGSESGGEEGQFVELAHEALARSWPRLQEWIEESRSDLMIHRRLAEAAGQWAQHGCEPAYLYRGARLAEAARWTERNADRLNPEEAAFLRASAQAEVQQFLALPPDEVGQGLHELAALRPCVEPELRRTLSASPPPDESQDLRLRLALLKWDEEQAESLMQHFRTLDPKLLNVTVAALRPHAERLLDDLWALLEDHQTEAEVQLRVGCALAAYDADNARWRHVASDLALSLVRENLLSLGEWVPTLRPIREWLRGPLQEVFQNSELEESVREAAGVTLAEFFHDLPHLLAKLVSEADVPAFEVLFRALPSDGGHKQEVLRVLKRIAQTNPSDDLLEEARVLLGQHRAGAVIAHLRLCGIEDAGAAINALRVNDDPEALTQFVHRCRECGVDCDALTDLLMESKEPKIRYGLLLALGEFPRESVSSDRWAWLKRNLPQWYASHPSAALHGAVGWLLNRWGLHEKRALIDETRREYEMGFEWFIEPVVGRMTTFTVIEPVTYWAGSPPEEAGRRSDEALHAVTLTYSFAIARYPVTRGEFEKFLKESAYSDFPDISEWSAEDETPIVGVTWADAIAYCQWATEKSGIASEEQCYRQVEGGPLPAGTVVTAITCDHRKCGYRLPTEAEWELACRSGTRTAYSFGNDRRLLRHYGWYLYNSENRTHPVGILRPNMNGLLDMHGNVYEWCNDWHEPYPETPVTDPVGPSKGQRHVLRGGGWFGDERHCRSATRYLEPPGRGTLGFRIVRTLSLRASDRGPALCEQKPGNPRIKEKGLVCVV